MKLLRVAWKVLVEFWREPQLLVLVVGLPVFFVVITAVGYGTSPRLATYRVSLYVADGLSTGIVQRLESARYEDGRKVFLIDKAENIEAFEDALTRGDSVLGVRVQQVSAGSTEIVIKGDGTSMAFNRAALQLERILKEDSQDDLRLAERGLPLHGAVSDFQLYAPGMIVFAILLLIPQTAMLVGREVREGTLERLRLSRLSGAEWMSGLALSQMLIAVLQVIFTFAAAALFGFRSAGSLLLAILISLLLSLSAVAMGLAVGRFSRSDSDAINVGSVFTMLQVFLSGSFFAMPGPTLLSLGGVPLGFADVLPATHANLLLQQVMVGGADFAFAWPRLVVMAGLSVVLGGVCLVIFRRK
jgi:ABC-2 type transport system permease protein